MARRQPSLMDTIKDGFAWTVIFFGLFLLICKWVSGA
jgi:hypothetical protein